MDGFGVQRDIARERSAFRIAEVAAEVDVCDDKNAAWAQGLADFSDDGAGIGQMSQKKSGVNKIKLRRGLGFAEIANAKFEVRNTQCCSFFPRDSNLDFVNVHGDDCSAWTNKAR